MDTKEFTFKSATGVCDIWGCEYTPDSGDVKAVIVMHHGMAEHSARYQAYFEHLTSEGFAVFMHDMANHGKSNIDFNISGYFGEKDGYKALIADLKIVFDKAKAEYPDKKIIVFGHSMGSFIVRCFTAKFGSMIDGAVFMGTGGPNPIAGMGDKLSAFVSKAKGKFYKSKTLDKLTFGAYNAKFEGRTPFDWLTRDDAIVDKYIADRYCGFLFSAQGMNDLVKLNIESNTKEWYNAVPKDLPILITSGEMDPVGEYGKGLRTIEANLIGTGHKKVTLKLYPDCRHEILNELNKEEVYADIDSFIVNKVLN
jgi:alpha-beta hydrolase superfamily lysophospholipase